MDNQLNDDVRFEVQGQPAHGDNQPASPSGWSTADTAVDDAPEGDEGDEGDGGDTVTVGGGMSQHDAPRESSGGF